MDTDSIIVNFSDKIEKLKFDATECSDVESTEFYQ